LLASEVGMATRVFISYSHDSGAHVEFVLALADALRRRGFDAWIDQYEESPPQGWPRWCREQCELAEFVLAVCTPTYRQRFEGRAPTGVGLGASWEGFVLANEIYAAQGRNLRVVPVLPGGGELDDVPVELRGASVYWLHEPTGFEKLCRRLMRNDHVDPPPLGSLHPEAPRPRRTLFESSGPEFEPGLTAALFEQWDLCAREKTELETAHKLLVLLRVAPDYVREAFDCAGPGVAAKIETWLRRQAEKSVLMPGRVLREPTPLAADRTLVAARALAASEAGLLTDARHVLLAILSDEDSRTVAEIRKAVDASAEGAFDVVKRFAAQSAPANARRSQVSSLDLGGRDAVAHS
jgi:hypothetical protein